MSRDETRRGELGEALPRFRLLDRAGAGMSGEVYRARDRELGREVALKVLRIGDGPLCDELVERFQREAELLATHPHQGLVPVYDVVLDHSPPYLVLGWMDGGDLRGRLERQGPAPRSELVRIGLRLASALGHLHRHGILHRDVKGANVLFDGAGEPYLADLGLARTAPGRDLTATGHVVGTPRYMAPELLRTGNYSAGSDLFALGALLLEVHRGRVLEGEASDHAWIQGALDQVADRPLRRLLRACLRSDPTDRPPDADALVEELCALEEGGEASPGRTLGLSPVDPTLSVVDAPPSSSPPAVASPAVWAPTRAAAAACVLVAFLLGLTGVLGLPAPAPTPPVSAPAPPPQGRPAHPLEGLGERLAVGLDRVLAMHFDRTGRPVSGDEVGEPFHEAFWRHGAKLLDHLEEEREFFDWLALGGRPEELPPEIVEELLEHDRALTSLGLPPSFGPLLAARPLPAPAPAPASFAGHPALTARHGAALATPRGGWTGRALKALAQTLEQYEAIWARLDEQLPGSVPSWEPPHPGRSPGLRSRPLEDHLNQVRHLGGSLESLERALAPGRDAYRTALHTTLRALDAEAVHAPVLLGLFLQLEPFFRILLGGSLLTADRSRLLGAEPRRFEARYAFMHAWRELNLLRERYVLGPAPTSPAHVEGWRRTLEAGLATDDRGHTALALVRLSRTLWEAGRWEDILALQARHHARLVRELSPEERDLLARHRGQARAALAARSAAPRPDPGDGGVPRNTSPSPAAGR